MSEQQIVQAIRRQVREVLADRVAGNRWKEQRIAEIFGSALLMTEIHLQQSASRQTERQTFLSRMVQIEKLRQKLLSEPV